MATDGIFAAAALNLDVGSSFATTTAALRTAVSERFLKNGRGYKLGNGGGRQKLYSCSGAATAGSTVVPGCPAEVLATLSSKLEWQISYAEFEHTNCSGGRARTRMYVWDHPACGTRHNHSNGGSGVA